MNEDLIDFPCSYTWRAYYAETIDGVYLPSIEPPPERPMAIDWRDEVEGLTKQQVPRKLMDILNRLESNQVDLRKTLYKSLKEKETKVNRKRKSYKDNRYNKYTT